MHKERNLSSTTVITIKLFSNHYIRMISEGSCDNEDWNNILLLINYNISQYYCLYSPFNKVHPCEHKIYIFSKTLKKLKKSYWLILFLKNTHKYI